MLRRRIRCVAAVTITWNVIEAAVALTAGHAASSAALIGFGLAAYVSVDALLSLLGLREAEHSPRTRSRR